MATPKRTPSIQIRLAPNDQIKFDLCCRLSGKNRNELARQAILYYMDRRDSDETQVAETPYAERLKKVEDRVAAILAKSSYENNKRLDALTNRLSKMNARIAIDIGLVYMIMYRMMNKETRREVVEWAASSVLTRLEDKFKHPDTDIQQLMNWLEEEPSNHASNSRQA